MKKRNFLKALTVCVMVLMMGIMPVYAAGIDSASDWAKETITNAIELKLVPEDLQDAYTQDITRAEFCSLVVTYIEVMTEKSMEEYLTQEGVEVDAAVFTDTEDGDILAANALEIVNGVGNGLFNPDGKITREQAAAMLTRTQGALGIDTAVTEGSDFADSDTFSSYAVTAINYVAAEGIMTGVGNDMFSPKGNYTREQAIATFYRMHGAEAEAPADDAAGADDAEKADDAAGADDAKKADEK